MLGNRRARGKLEATSHDRIMLERFTYEDFGQNRTKLPDANVWVWRAINLGLYAGFCFKSQKFSCISRTGGNRCKSPPTFFWISGKFHSKTPLFPWHIYVLPPKVAKIPSILAKNSKNRSKFVKFVKNGHLWAIMHKNRKFSGNHVNSPDFA